MTKLCLGLNKSLLASQNPELAIGIGPTHITVFQKTYVSNFSFKWENVVLKENVLLHLTESFHIIAPRTCVISHHWTERKKDSEQLNIEESDRMRNEY